MINHNNVLFFYGLYEVNDYMFIVNEYCTKGELQDILLNEKFNLDDNFKVIIDLVFNGLLLTLLSKLNLFTELFMACYLLYKMNYIYFLYCRISECSHFLDRSPTIVLSLL